MAVFQKTQQNNQTSLLKKRIQKAHQFITKSLLLRSKLISLKNPYHLVHNPKKLSILK